MSKFAATTTRRELLSSVCCANSKMASKEVVLCLPCGEEIKEVDATCTRLLRDGDEEVWRELACSGCKKHNRDGGRSKRAKTNACEQHWLTGYETSRYDYIVERYHLFHEFLGSQKVAVKEMRGAPERAGFESRHEGA